jgi:30S ribosomal protein S31
MGKGDKKSKRGKIHKGTFGVRRPRIKKRPRTEDKINPNKKK